MISLESPWTLAICADAARDVAAVHGIDVHAYIEGSAAGSIVRVDLKRGEERLCWIEIETTDLERCADVDEVRRLVVEQVGHPLRRVQCTRCREVFVLAETQQHTTGCWLHPTGGAASFVLIDRQGVS